MVKRVVILQIISVENSKQTVVLVFKNECQCHALVMDNWSENHNQNIDNDFTTELSIR